MTAQTAELQTPADPMAPAGVALTQAQVEANAATRSKLTLQAQYQVAALLEAFHGWYNDSAVRDLGRQIAQVLRPAQQSMTTAQAAYLNWSIQAQTGRAVAPGKLIDVTALRAGTTPEQTYARLGEQYRYSKSISDFQNAEQAHLAALQATLSRANVMVDTDMALAARKQSQATLRESKAVTGYRRVVHPELSEGGTCGMCLVASDRVYHKADLMPMHARCHCEVVPITKGSDPGASLNNLSLADLYDHAQGDQIFDLVRTRYKVEHHDELSPQLVPATHPTKGWHEGASADQLARLRQAVKQREGSAKVGRDMDARLARMQKTAERAERRAARAANH